jgi:hypothetical protein
MPKVTFLPHEEICPQGAEIEVKSGITICDAALNNGIEIEHVKNPVHVQLVMSSFKKALTL